MLGERCSKVFAFETKLNIRGAVLMLLMRPPKVAEKREAAQDAELGMTKAEMKMRGGQSGR
jgi:hypothetical protein